MNRVPRQAAGRSAASLAEPMPIAAGQPRTKLRLIADDLTGALDTAVEFVAALGPVRVCWGRVPAEAGDALAFDIATREGSEAEAFETIGRVAAATGLSASDCAYVKLDSLLRGHAGAEIAACWAGGGFEAAVIAPAFPYQGRITVDGRQRLVTPGTPDAIGEDLAATLRAYGLPVRKRRAGTSVWAGIALWNAASDADLDAIVDAALLAEGRGRRILWCGSGGLAGAIARRRFGVAAPEAFMPEGPILGLFGTDHPVTQDQLVQAGDATIRLADSSAASADHVSGQLDQRGAALVTVDLPPLSRRAAARRIASDLGALANRLDPPATLVCSGGETLRRLCDSLGATSLDVIGRIVPGVAVARFRGGRWDGVPVISKSGAFGDPDFLKRLVAPSLASAPGRPRPRATRTRQQ
ncbi:MAG: four-carbon acid sugar kinase family protein [Ancalomicrobiaceae bacterium]|nr:four-carbon acid sugar kinase family protein [Ancalomicrobiaceae bacterium]